MMKILRNIFGILIIAAISLAVVRCTKDPEPIKTLKGKSEIAVLPCDSTRFTVKVTPNITAYVDMGKVHNLITAEDLEMLKDLDYRIDSVRCLALVQDNNKKYSLCTKRYNVDLPVWKWETVTDSAGNRISRPIGKRPANVIYNVDFYLAEEGDSTTLALDLLSHTVLEYRAHTNEIALHTQVPGGYQEVGDIERRRTFSDYFGLRPRYYVNLKANNTKEWFLLSSMDYATSIKMPSNAKPKNAQAQRTTEKIVDGTTIVCDQKGWVEYGDRAGAHRICFYDLPILPTEYVFNPLSFFEQNVVVDFLHNKIMLHPHVTAMKKSSVPSES